MCPAIHSKIKYKRPEKTFIVVRLKTFMQIQKPFSIPVLSRFLPSFLIFFQVLLSSSIPISLGHTCLASFDPFFLHHFISFLLSFIAFILPFLPRSILHLFFPPSLCLCTSPIPWRSEHIMGDGLSCTTNTKKETG